MSDDTVQKAGAAGSSPDAHNGATDAADAITQKLKSLYDTVAQEPVPDRFQELLKQLDNQSQKED